MCRSIRARLNLILSNREFIKFKRALCEFSWKAWINYAYCVNVLYRMNIHLCTSLSCIISYLGIKRNSRLLWNSLQLGKNLDLSCLFLSAKSQRYSHLTLHRYLFHFFVNSCVKITITASINQIVSIVFTLVHFIMIFLSLLMGRVDWKCQNEYDGPNHRAWKCRTWKCRTENAKTRTTCYGFKAINLCQLRTNFAPKTWQHRETSKSCSSYS